MDLKKHTKFTTPKRDICKACAALSLVVMASPFLLSKERGENTCQRAEPSTWSAVDGLGRFMPEYDNVGPKRKNKFVGIFFWTWHGKYGADDPVNRAWESPSRGEGTVNVQRVMDESPSAKNDFNHPAWMGMCSGNGIGTGHWNEPIWGYYFSDDEWVLRRQGMMLAAADVDAVIFDCTNGLTTWERGYTALAKVFSKMKDEGINVPGMVFMSPIHPKYEQSRHGDKPLTNAELNAIQLRELWGKIYSKGLYRQLWFYWKGKPLILAFPEGLDASDPTDKKILDFFTFRPAQSSYTEGQNDTTKERMWGWLSVYPQAVYNNDDGSPEQTTVGVAMNTNARARWAKQYSKTYADLTGADGIWYGSVSCMNGEGIFGRSYTSKGFDPRPNSKLYGANFQEQWDYALRVDPEFIFITGWNEWIGAHRKVRTGVPNGFSDQFDDEHSRDCEPTKGDLKDHYYYQMCANIRKFKGAHEPTVAVKKCELSLDSSAEDWAKKAATFKDFKKDLTARDAAGYYHYKSDTGRNALETSRVSHDDDFVYFEVVSPKKLTPPSGGKWMRLLIRAPIEGATYQGFQFILNRFAPKDKAYLEQSLGGWSWRIVAECDYRIQDNRFLVKIPRKILGADIPMFELRFKWCDNNLESGDIMSLYTDGDTTPYGRFTYLYKANDLPERAFKFSNVKFPFPASKKPRIKQNK